MFALKDGNLYLKLAFGIAKFNLLQMTEIKYLQAPPRWRSGAWQWRLGLELLEKSTLNFFYHVAGEPRDPMAVTYLFLPGPHLSLSVGRCAKRLSATFAVFLQTGARRPTFSASGAARPSTFRSAINSQKYSHQNLNRSGIKC